MKHTEKRSFRFDETFDKKSTQVSFSNLHWGTVNLVYALPRDLEAIDQISGLYGRIQFNKTKLLNFSVEIKFKESFPYKRKFLEDLG